MMATVHILLITLLAIGLAWRIVRHRGRLPLPPGPSGYPLLGNLTDIPKEFAWLRFRQWSKDFDSDVILLKKWGSSIIILNSWDAANDLLTKQSPDYSDRPRFAMLNELIGFEWAFAFMAYNDDWKARRALFEHDFGSADKTWYQRQLSTSVTRLLLSLLETPSNFMDHTRHMPGALMLSIAYGIDIQAKDDAYIQVAEEAMHSMSLAGIWGTFLVDHMPFLKYLPSWFPGAGFRTVGTECFYYVQKMFHDPYAAAKRKIAAGDAKMSFTSQALEQMDQTVDVPGQERLIQETAGNLYAAGADTTVAALDTFFLAFCTPKFKIRHDKN
ncbi:hypothetical protein HGRIS_000662 [Hohenbuehelia grisea]|uniref:Cytochrome P450 n=1 Tax=Hohenbuehelia grisea TaxID=104357 RepID=A0ABR3JRP0_9AGAR